ncbi:MAG: hypothetical protein HUK20_08455, partial [Fibrobacter sp.]|nr:hypothetical protein [Fibrobacter sp.]
YTDDQFCSGDDEITDKCGGELYDTKKVFCFANKIYDKCGEDIYNPSTQWCNNGTVEALSSCGEDLYNLSTQWCNKCPNCNGGKVEDLLIDTRDGKTQKYKTVTIGEQIWMAENLNYETTNSWCYKGQADSCAKYGRLYTWVAAMQACPEGWHVPTNAEYTTLYTYNGGTTDNAGTHLKSTSGWKYSDNGTDDYGFSVLPAGNRDLSDYFYDVGLYASLWSATERYSDYAYYQRFSALTSRVSQFGDLKVYGYSLRCIQDLYRCGEDLYDPTTQWCNNGTIKALSSCGEDLYNPSTHWCNNGTIWELCGTETYNSTQFCLDGVVTDKCGGESYTAKQFCLDGVVTDKCDGETFSADQFCLENKVTDKCGGEIYTSDKFCLDGVITDKCAGKKYTDDQFCVNDTVYDKCNGEPYDTKKVFCFANKIYDKCGSKVYDPSKQYCSFGDIYGYFIDERDGKRYTITTIGTQAWMASNLDYKYNGRGSSCYGYSADSCAKYGRLYTWAAAMDSAGLVDTKNKVAHFDYEGNETGTGCGYGVRCTPNTPHRGICPEGWHVPTNDEYTTLYTYIGGTKDAGTRLKYVQGWYYYNGDGWKMYGNGDGSYRFYLHPAGCIGPGDGCAGSVGHYAFLWSASEDNSNDAYHQSFSAVSSSVYQSSYYKYRGYSLRCLQDSN